MTSGNQTGSAAWLFVLPHDVYPKSLQLFGIMLEADTDQLFS
jgi:hypothetical protein